jgi:WD40 repeat protein
MDLSKLFLVIVLTVLLCGFLAGCGKNEKEANANEKSAKAEEQEIVERPPRWGWERGVEVGNAAFSPDGKLLIVASRPGLVHGPRGHFFYQRLIKLWDVESGQELHTFIPDDQPTEVFFFDGGKKILASDEASVTIFDVASRKKEAKYLRGGRPLAMFPDGKKLLVFTEDNRGEALELWDPLTAKVLQRFPGGNNPNKGTIISPDAKWALVPCGSNTQGIFLQLWDLSKGQVKFSFLRKDPFIKPLGFAPDSKSWIGEILEEKTEEEPEPSALYLFEVPSGKKVRVLERSSHQRSIAGFSPDGKQFVAVDPGRFRRLIVETGQILCYPPIYHQSERQVFVLSPDGTRLFMGGGADMSSSFEYLRMEIWDAVRGEKTHQLLVNRNWIYDERYRKTINQEQEKHLRAIRNTGPPFEK